MHRSVCVHATARATQQLAQFVVRSHARSHPITKADELANKPEDEMQASTPEAVVRAGL